MDNWLALWRIMDAGRLLDEVEAAIAACLKPCGFTRHGHVFHRFVEGDISQVVEVVPEAAFVRRRSFRIRAGVRVPECALMTFSPSEYVKYHDSDECDLICELQTADRRSGGVFVLQDPVEPLCGRILGQLRERVLPAFATLCSRDAILVRRHAFPDFSPSGFTPVQEAMIHGRRGDLRRAEAVLSEYCRRGETWMPPAARRLHRAYLHAVAARLGLMLRE